MTISIRAGYNVEHVHVSQYRVCYGGFQTSSFFHPSSTRTEILEMASGRDEWASSSQSLKRESKYLFKAVRDSVRDSIRDSFREFSSSSTENTANAQDAAPNVEPTHSQQVVSSSPASFQYDALPGKGFIRLLTILPGDDEEVIPLRLSAVMLHDSVGGYESLSYVWFVFHHAPHA